MNVRIMKSFLDSVIRTWCILVLSRALHIVFFEYFANEGLQSTKPYQNLKIAAYKHFDCQGRSSICCNVSGVLKISRRPKKLL